MTHGRCAHYSLILCEREQRRFFGRFPLQLTCSPLTKDHTDGKKESSSSKVPAKTSAPSNGKGARPAPGPGGFTNPVIAEAFRRAVKKYPSAFRRLTD